MVGPSQSMHHTDGGCATASMATDSKLERCRADADYYRPVRRRFALIIGVLVLTMEGCGGSNVAVRARTEPPQISLDTLRADIHSTKVARQLPRTVLRSCERARAKATVPVRCPRLAPGGRITGEVLLPRRSRPGGPGAVGDAGVLRYRSSRAIYVLTFMSSALSDHHWMVAGGRTAEVTSQFLQPGGGGSLPPSQTVSYAGRTLSVARYPPYPAGGVNGGHVVVSVTQGAMTYVASVHGYAHQDLAIGLLSSML
jgi:hypothetical protein